jgi:transaldolase
MALCVLERLSNSHPDLEIWWDSVPFVYDQFCAKLLDAVTPDRREVVRLALSRLYNADAPAQSVFDGVTTNPPLSLQAIEADPPYWNAFMDDVIANNPAISPEELFTATYHAVVRKGAGYYHQMFQESKGQKGYVSAQLDPRLYCDRDGMLAQALSLAEIAPNVMIKVPGTAEGYQVIEELTARGIATNNTMSIIMSQIATCARAVQKGLTRAKANNVSLARFRSVITHMAARFTKLGPIKQEAAELKISLTEEDLRWAELSLTKKMCRMIVEGNFQSKILVCSLVTGPDTEETGKHVWHFEKLAGGPVVFTCPPSFIFTAIKDYDDISLSSEGFSEQVPASTLEKLMQIPYFRSGFADDGYQPVDFVSHPAVNTTAQQHIAVTNQFVKYCADRIAKSKGGLRIHVDASSDAPACVDFTQSTSPMPKST